MLQLYLWVIIALILLMRKSKFCLCSNKGYILLMFSKWVYAAKNMHKLRVFFHKCNQKCQLRWNYCFVYSMFSLNTVCAFRLVIKKNSKNCFHAIWGNLLHQTHRNCVTFSSLVFSVLDSDRERVIGGFTEC